MSFENSEDRFERSACPKRFAQEQVFVASLWRKHFPKVSKLELSIKSFPIKKEFQLRALPRERERNKQKQIRRIIMISTRPDQGYWPEICEVLRHDPSEQKSRLRSSSGLIISRSRLPRCSLNFLWAPSKFLGDASKVLRRRNGKLEIRLHRPEAASGSTKVNRERAREKRGLQRSNSLHC